MATGRIIDQARKDARRFATAGGFEEDITLSTPDGSSEFLGKGLTTGHWINFDNSGNSVNTTSNHIDISETDLILAEYPYKNTKTGRVALTDHKVTVRGETFVINECHPNSTTGLIICILGQKKQ